MIGLIFAVTTAASTPFSDYPGFVDPEAIVEARIDRGPIVELIVKCGEGAAIISYSKIERVFCTPQLVCGPGLKRAISATCR